MNTSLFTLPLMMGAPAGAANADPQGSMISTLVMFGLVFVVFYFLIIRPQNKKQKEAKKMLASLKKGDKVQTIGGLRGIVHAIKEKEDTIIIKVDDNAKMEFVRSAIATVVEQKPADDEADTKEISSDSDK